MSKPIAVTDSSFKADVLQANKPVLVDFWAPWCGPCQMIAPIVEGVAQEYAGQVTVAKLNTDENPETPTKYGVMGIPTLMLFKGGEIVERLTGFIHKDRLVPILTRHLD